MGKPALRFLAVFLTALIVVVLFAGLDNLPRGVRASIAAEQQSLQEASRQLAAARDALAKDFAANPTLFHARSLDTALPARLEGAQQRLKDAGQEMALLAALNQKNRRTDAAEAEQHLGRERGLRSGALQEVAAVRAQADRLLQQERDLPKTLARLESDRQALHAFDFAPVAAVVAKAESDWPDKKDDLEIRLAALRAIPVEADKTLEAAAPLRAQAAARDYAHLDFDLLAKDADALDASLAALPNKAGELKSLTGQLYDSWDKVLVDLDTRHRGIHKEYVEKIRTVRTHLTDIAAQKGETSSEERWVEVPKDEYARVEKNLGMAIEHKAAGKYDSEADRVAQPAGFAYMASPAQGSNQYGHWEHSNGQSFWVWYGQYALLRDLLFSRDYRPLTTRDYDEFRTARSSGRTYYGRDETFADLPKYGTGGTLTQRHYSSSEYARNGGFKNSPFAKRAGGYGNSKFQPPGYRHRDESGFRSRPSGPSRSFGRSVPRSFGRAFGRRR